MRSVLAPLISLLLLLLAIVPVTGRCASEIVILTADSSGPFGEFIETFRGGIRDSHEAATVSVKSPSQWISEGQSAEAPALVIPLGASAVQAALSRPGRVPVLAALLPRRAWERVVVAGGLRTDGRPLSAIFLDQPVARQVRFLQLAFPERRRWLVPSGPESRPAAELLSAAARERGIQVHIEAIADRDELYPALARQLEHADLLVGLPDPLVFNSHSIRGVLLSSYRFRVPLFAFSPTYARAGALLTLSSTPKQIASQALEVSLRALAGQPLPAPAWPQEFRVDVNEAVARSLGIVLPGAEELRQQLMAREANR